MNITDELLKLMNKAIKKNEVPIACIITKDDKIIAKAYNKTNRTNNILDHAEIIAIIEETLKQKIVQNTDFIRYSYFEINVKYNFTEEDKRKFEDLQNGYFIIKFERLESIKKGNTEGMGIIHMVNVNQ